MVRAPTIAVVFLWALGTLMLGESPAEDQPDARRLEYRNDRLTVDVQGAPLADLLTEFGRRSGARIRGQVRKPRDLSLSFEEVPLPDALERLLGDQNFTLRYGPGNRLEAVDLLGEPGALRSSAASATDTTGTGSARSPGPRAGVGGSNAAAGGQGSRAAGLSVSGPAAPSGQAGAPASAVMLGGGAQQTTAQSQQSSNNDQQTSDAELQQRVPRSLLNSLTSMDDGSLAAFMDTPEGRRVQALLQYYADHHVGSHRQQQAASIIDRIPAPPTPAPAPGSPSHHTWR